MGRAHRHRKTLPAASSACWSLTVCALLGCGAAEEADVDQGLATAATPIVHGSRTDGDVAVVQLQGGPGACTGTLVASRVVVTAAHCVGVPPTHVFFGTDPDEGGWTAEVMAAHAHPDFDPVRFANDIAVVELTAVVPVAPIPLGRTSLTPSDVGRPVRLVGFGVGDDDESQTKREGWAVITEVAASAITTAPSPSSPCTGDSGGPALMTTDTGEVLAGVISAGDSACKSMAVETRVDAYTEFLAPFMDEAAPGDGCALRHSRGGEGFGFFLILTTLGLASSRAPRRSRRPRKARPPGRGHSR